MKEPKEVALDLITKMNIKLTQDEKDLLHDKQLLKVSF